MALTINSLSLLTSTDKNVLQNIFVAVQAELERMQKEIDALKTGKKLG
jgi:hypothetical protein